LKSDELATPEPVVDDGLLYEVAAPDEAVESSAAAGDSKDDSAPAKEVKQPSLFEANQRPEKKPGA
jgi:hypothetical protein